MNSRKTWGILENQLKNILPDYLASPARSIKRILRSMLFAYRTTKSKIRARRITSKGGVIRIELGSQQKRNGFYTVDLGTSADLALDLSKPMPFPDGCIDMVYSSHLLEHFHYRDLIRLLTDVHRILKPGGEFYIVVPDAAIYIRGYLDFSQFDVERFIGNDNPYFHFHGRMDLINYVAHTDGHHKHIFDAENLINTLKFVGFKDAYLREFDPMLDLEVRKHVSIHAKAVK